MSVSTVSVTANTAAAARRRPVALGERKAGLDLGCSDAFAASPASVSNDRVTGGDLGLGIGRDYGHSIRGGGEAVHERARVAVPKKPSQPPNSSGAALPCKTSVSRKGSAKAEKPKWKTVVSVITKNFVLLLVLLLLVQMIRRLAVNQGSQGSILSTDYEGRIAEVESFLKKTTKMMQVQLEVVDRKIENEVTGLRSEFSEKIDHNGVEFETRMRTLESKVDGLERSFSSVEWVEKSDFENFVEEFKKAKGVDPGDSNLKLDELMDFAREIVEKEIEKHVADGLGMVDYALASGGAMVVKHSKPYVSGKVSSWFNRNGVHGDAVKMLRPSFGEPGQCFPLKGKTGFVQIKLMTAIIPEAVTLEHVSRSVAYDRSSAPKDCKVFGWLRGQDATDQVVNTENVLLLTEFTYDLEKSNAQTFKVLQAEDSTIINTIRFDFSSNHGSPSHTCIYRFRVHGREPDSILPLEIQP